MPRYFFHIFSDEVTRDEEGVELSGPFVAFALARAGAKELAVASMKEGRRISLDHRIEVETLSRHHVVTVAFEDALAAGD